MHVHSVECFFFKTMVSLLSQVARIGMELATNLCRKLEFQTIFDTISNHHAKRDYARANQESDHLPGTGQRLQVKFSDLEVQVQKLLKTHPDPKDRIALDLGFAILKVLPFLYLVQLF